MNYSETISAATTPPWKYRKCLAGRYTVLCFLHRDYPEWPPASTKNKPTLAIFFARLLAGSILSAL